MLNKQKGTPMYLYRSSPQAQLEAHRLERHGYPCDYIGGDSGLEVVAEDYQLFLDRGEEAVFRNMRSGEYHAAVRIGQLSMSPLGDDWRQQQADIILACETFHTAQLSRFVGPFTFYDLVFVLEAGQVTPREAIAAGYFGEAISTLRGHMRFLACTTPDEAVALLRLLTKENPSV
jgi:hypothetical protein